MDRSRKREEGDEPPTDKRACSSSEYRSSCSSSPTSSSSPPPPPPPPPPAQQPDADDCDMETSSSSARSSERGGAGGDSAYGSCGSHDNSDREHDEDDDDDVMEEEDEGRNPSECPVSKARLQRVFSSLQEDGSGGSMQLAALTELCEVLAFCTEDTIGYFPLDTIVPVLVRLAGEETNPDVMLLSIRALTYLCDALPRSAAAIVRHGALPVLCGRLLEIEYMDVAEQSLQALEKISRKQQVACLQAGTIYAVLSFLDFFSTTLQRVAVLTVANLCKMIPSDCSATVMQSIPMLCNLLQYEDQKLVEIVATCLIRIANSFSHSPVLVDELCNQGIIQKSLDLIANVNRTLSRSTYTGLISLLTKLAKNSLVAVKILYEQNVGSNLRDILMAIDHSHSTSYPSFEDANSNQVHEVLNLINQLIPSAARDMQDTQLVLTKENFLKDHPSFLHQFSVDVLPASIQVVNSGANAYVCYGCVSIIHNIVYFSTPSMLQNLIKDLNISSFLAGLLARKEHHILNLTLKTIEILMQKLPGVFLSSFIKEGVIYAIDTLSSQEKSLNPVSEPSNQVHNLENQTSAINISRCLCYAFDSPSSPSSEPNVCKLGKDTTSSLARHIKVAFFNPEIVHAEIGLTEILQKLRNFCSVLNDNVDRCSTSDGFLQNEDYLTHILDQVLTELHGGEAMSTFEFIESGIVRSLAHYLSNGKYLSGSSSDCTSSNHFLSVLKRLQKFAHICLSEQHQSWENMLLTLLLRKLQNALSSLDNFPVILSYAFKPRNTYTDIPVSRSTANPCLKVRFLRDENDKNLSDFNDVINIEISSSLDAIEGYLWPKVSKAKNNCHSRIAHDAIYISNHDAIRDSSNNCAGDMQEPAVSMPAEGTSIQDQQSHVVDTSDPAGVSPPIGPCSCKREVKSKRSRADVEGAKSNLIFYLGGKQLNRSMTLYQAILQGQISTESDMVVGPKLLNEVYEITYKGIGEETSVICRPNPEDPFPSLCCAGLEFPWHKLSFISNAFSAELSCGLDKLNPTYDILFMLKVLEGLNRFSFHLLSDDRINAFAEGTVNNFDDLKVTIISVPLVEFINSKLTDKLEQQLRDPLVLSSCSMPIWCSQLMASCPFLFSFETKWKFFNLTSFGPAKFQQYHIQNPDNNDTNTPTERRSVSVTPRKKFKVNRYNILESAMKMMELHAQSKSVVEVEYIEEVGTGLGPTLEFYTLVSREVQKVGLGMWRGDLGLQVGTNKEVGEFKYVSAPFGLFPRPWSPRTGVTNVDESTEVIKLFLLLGKLVAKAIKDGRILDIPFSKAFYKIMLDQELGICDIQTFDPELGTTLLEFHAISRRRKFLQSVSAENGNISLDLNYRNAAIEDLCLDFTLPGYSDYLLTSESPQKVVNTANLEEYVALVVDATIRNGISRQVEAFKSGFNQVFPLKTLQIFTENELERLLCGEQDTWNFSELVDHVKFDHGYTASSPTVIYLLEIIQEFDCDERRAFLQFVTGAPRLPPGGLAALNPKLTVVRKHSSGIADTDLPSVMTCANYLKLPPYTCKERIRERLLYAITEGQGSFHLS